MKKEIKTVFKIEYEDERYKELSECLLQIAELTKRALQLDFEIKKNALLNRDREFDQRRGENITINGLDSDLRIDQATNAIRDQLKEARTQALLE